MDAAVKKIVVLALAFVGAFGASAETLREKIEKDHRIVKTEPWYGGSTRITFDFNGRKAWIAEPKGTPAEGFPWTWTMQWADAFVPRTGVPALLERGFHHVTIDLFDTRMDDNGVALAAVFQKYLVERLGFAPKARLVGPSWGGFFSARYAAAHPENVARIYFDAPLMNLGGRGDISEKRIGPWAKTGVADEAFISDPRMPVNLSDKIAKAGIPVLLLYGTADGVVPPRINCELFVERFKTAGGDIAVYPRAGVDHHPHGFEPERVNVIVDFLGAGATKPLKVLMIGNSFSICVLKQGPAIAKDFDCDLRLCSVYIGGCPLECHANNLAESEADPSKKQYHVTSNFGLEGSYGLPEILQKDAWDVVTIQQASHCSPFADTYEPYAEQLIAGIRKYAPHAEIRVQQTWSYTTLDSRVWSRADGRGTWNHNSETFRWNQADMFERLEDNYSDLAKRYGFKVIPTGKAIQLFRERRPCTFVPLTEEAKKLVKTAADIPLSDDAVGAYHFNKKGELCADSIHLNARGEYLQGLVWIGSIFDVDPNGCKYRPEFVTEADARLFRACAHDALESQAKEKPRELFNGKDLTGWYTYLRGYGKDNDPKGVVSVKDGVLRITGEEWGAVVTEEEFSDYRLDVEYRFTGTRFGDKANKALDSGILFHSTGPDGAFYDTWLYSHEYNLITGASGDIWTVGDVKARPDMVVEGETGGTFTDVTMPEGPYRTHAVWKEGGDKIELRGNRRLCRYDIAPDWTDTPAAPYAENERPTGEWNTATLVCRGESVECWFNGRLVNKAIRVVPSRGKIQLQSEGCGVEFRRVTLRSVGATYGDLPDESHAGVSCEMKGKGL